ncbi:MAG: NAD(P)/FAD-dependent oxidoreductase [Alphaproteobacteria bacterium]|nr:NAD(P)/FAD-dependent oxidoreductase [Alphaproteobacteria bacterium]
MQHVIVGAGPAGVVAAETLRKGDPKAKITLIGGEPEPPYSRMAIPYLLDGNIAEEGTYLRKGAKHYDALGIQYVHGRAESVAPAEGKLKLEGGDQVPFDRLLVATGARPIQPRVPGIDRPGIHGCWTLADAREIAKLSKSGSNIVLVGAGFIGCIIMEALASRGGNLTVVEMEDRMLARMMDATGGAMMRRWCENKKIRVLTGRKVVGVEADAKGPGDKAVALDNGEKLNAHLVVLAVGVRSNVEFLKGSGVKIDHGIVVNDQMQSSVANIYAAGDVAEGPDFSTGGHMVHAIQPTAVDHGRIAALNMLGKTAHYKGSLIMNVLDTVGLISSSFGKWEGTKGGESSAAVDNDRYRYLRLEFDGDHLIGALGIGMTEHVGVLRGLIQTKTALGDWKRKLLADPHRVMEAYVARSQV